jgi:hypothetical protein
MMEIIHDIAPGTTQAFHTAEGGQANFPQGIIELANAGAKGSTTISSISVSRCSRMAPLPRRSIR